MDQSYAWSIWLRDSPLASCSCLSNHHHHHRLCTFFSKNLGRCLIWEGMKGVWNLVESISLQWGKSTHFCHLRRPTSTTDSGSKSCTTNAPPPNPNPKIHQLNPTPNQTSIPRIFLPPPRPSFDSAFHEVTILHLQLLCHTQLFWLPIGMCSIAPMKSYSSRTKLSKSKQYWLDLIWREWNFFFRLEIYRCEMIPW